jgi:HD superfamily phosphodiesterase
LLFNHSHRVFFWANELVRKQKEQADAELRFICAAFHDLGPLKNFGSIADRFEVDGAKAVRQFLEHRRVPPLKVQVAWDAISLHTTPGITAYKSLEVECLYDNVPLDVLGIAYEMFLEVLKQERWRITKDRLRTRYCKGILGRLRTKGRYDRGYP